MLERVSVSTVWPEQQVRQRGPIIVDDAGGFYGVLTVNEFARDSICGVSGDARTCRALKVMCAVD